MSMSLRTSCPAATHAPQTVKVSKASAEQRCGRAGREGPGKCFRLYPEDEYDTMLDHAVPEIRRVQLTEYVLKLKALGIDDVIRFKMVDTPPVNAVIKAMETLYSLGALDTSGQLTDPQGRRMAVLPLNPMSARVLLAAGEFKCLRDVLTVVAMIGEEKVFYTPSSRTAADAGGRDSRNRRFASHDGDHITYLHVFNEYISVGKGKAKGGGGSGSGSGSSSLSARHERAKWCKENHVNSRTMSRVVDVRSQLERYCVGFGMNVHESALPDTEPIRRALVAGYMHHTARKQADGKYMTFVDRQVARIHPSSVLNGWHSPEFVLFNELVQTNKLYLRDLTAVDQAHLAKYGVYGAGAGAGTASASVADAEEVVPYMVQVHGQVRGRIGSGDGATSKSSAKGKASMFTRTGKFVQKNKPLSLIQ